jgi:hypothetical protein
MTTASDNLRGHEFDARMEIARGWHGRATKRQAAHIADSP